MPIKYKTQQKNKKLDDFVCFDRSLEEEEEDANKREEDN